MEYRSPQGEDMPQKPLDAFETTQATGRGVGRFFPCTPTHRRGWGVGQRPTMFCPLVLSGHAGGFDLLNPAGAPSRCLTRPLQGRDCSHLAVTATTQQIRWLRTALPPPRCLPPWLRASALLQRLDQHQAFALLADSASAFAPRALRQTPLELPGFFSGRRPRCPASEDFLPGLGKAHPLTSSLTFPPQLDGWEPYGLRFRRMRGRITFSLCKMPA